jgi:signal transduction histidine kinase
MEALLLSALVTTLIVVVRLRRRSAELRAVHAMLICRNQELEDMAQARGRFVARVSHELRNPLTAVLGFTELLQSGADPISRRQGEQLGIVRDSAEHARTLVDDLLELSHGQAGRLRLEPAPVEPSAVVRSAAASLCEMAELRDVALDVRAPELGVALIDPARLRQVVLNFLSNAIKFTPPGGRVRVRLAATPTGLRLSVADTGHGIAPEDQPRVFEEFFRAVGSETEGSGLGLAVTRMIVEAQGGQIQLRSRLGRGSLFAAELPTASLAETSLTPSDALRPASDPQALPA